VYSKFGSTTLIAMPAGAAAFSGLQVLWYVVCGCTLVAAGFALHRMLPRRER
jgi:hypothetical protein